jgi:hypothetical protein
MPYLTYRRWYRVRMYIRKSSISALHPKILSLFSVVPYLPPSHTHHIQERRNKMIRWYHLGPVGSVRRVDE